MWFFFFKQKTAYEMRISDWSSDVCSSDLPALNAAMKLDLYRLLTANGALASERDYQAYAEAAVQNGQYGEAKAIIEAGRAGGKLLSNDAATASIYKTASARATKDKAALTALAAKAGGASEAADAYLAWGDYARAAELYRAALKQTPADPGQVNTRLGIALARAGNVEEARKALAAVTGDRKSTRLNSSH